MRRPILRLAMTGEFDGAGYDRGDGKVSLWLSTVSLEGIPPAFLDGDDALFAWLQVDFGVAISGDFATNFSEDGRLVEVAQLTERLPFSEQFAAACVEHCEGLDMAQGSFVVALYNCAYEPKPGVSSESPFLRFAGSYDFR